MGNFDNVEYDWKEQESDIVDYGEKELLTAPDLLLKLCGEGLKRFVDAVLRFLQSSFLIASLYRKHSSSLIACIRILESAAHWKVLGIVIKPAGVRITDKGLDEAHTF